MDITNGNAPAYMADTDMMFEKLFKSQYKRLHAYACTILYDEDEAEEIVQQMFVKLWEKKEKLHELQSVNAYLYRAVHNDCMNYLKHEKVKANYRSHALHTGSEAASDASDNKLHQLEERLRQALAELPEQCRTIFQLSRFEELKYREIADRLGISVKTVENQMGKALKLMRIKMADLLPVLWIILQYM
ncbi:RNA polymerase sigma-70 factor [Chitinophagaceae bacterium IBVUCB1]|nr:RNA polymerase sigma-70 factor [Chitinophagaceae bacterium IBVUCB1]